MGKQRLPCSLARSLDISRRRGKQLALSPSLPAPVDRTQATEFLSRVHPPPRRCAKRRPCRRENIIQAWQIHYSSLSLFVFLLPRFFISCFFRGHLSAALGLQQPTQTTGINQFIHPSSLSLFSAPPSRILSSSSDCLRRSNDGDDGQRLRSHPCEWTMNGA